MRVQSPPPLFSPRVVPLAYEVPKLNAFAQHYQKHWLAAIYKKLKQEGIWIVDIF